MSDPKLISPLLDGFAMGTPISEHNGIRCCPAIKENTDKKYIVKILSVPATQKQMDALLLAGAYKDASGAMDYFRQQAEGILKEAELLKKLSKLEGFLSYEGWQMEPITRHRLGYEVYLVGSYKRSLEKYIRHHAVTHLEAVNLGLDMCAALSVSRQAGALYVNLKPSNIFLSDKKEYRIGDLGFLDIQELAYAALPDKYQSSYTPPELFDPMASINLTADTYALGMVLYQLYNDGTLPFRGRPPIEALPSPAHADYELAEIIMKAIDPDPANRWTDPAEMGKALASYMQRNVVNDTAITPLRTKKRKPKKVKNPEAVSEESSSSEDAVAVEETAAPSAEPETEVTVEDATVQTVEVAQEETAQVETAAALEEAAEEEPAAEEQEEELQMAEEQPSDAEEADNAAAEIPPEEELPVEAPEEPVSEELSKIFAKADDLIAHEAPEGVIFPEIPEEEDPFAFATEDEEDLDDSDIPYDPLMEEEPEPPKKKKKERKFADPKYKRRKKRLIGLLVTLLIFAAILFGMYVYYQSIYLQSVHSMTITGSQDQLTVTVDSEADDAILFVTCSSNYGASQTLPLTNGAAVFEDLEPNTMYTIQLSIDGFHALMGKTSDVYTTEATTKIVSFTSVAGAEDGSVILNFTVDGEEPELWSLVYSAEGEEAKEETFEGHSVTISGLSLGKVYTFTLDPGDALSLSGETSLELMATRLILAENLTVTSTGGSDMTVHWDSPGDVVVDSWNVRCYNAAGYDEQVTVTDTEVLFTGIDPAHEYTIEVVASGMTQPARAGITANPINITSFDVDDGDMDVLKLNWEFSGSAPEGGWLVMYSIDGSQNHVVKTDAPAAEIAPKIPGGKYTFTIQSADGISIFSNVHTYTVAAAVDYSGNALTKDLLKMDLVKTPAEERWRFESLGDGAITTQFAVGDPVSIVLRSEKSFYLPGAETSVLYVIRDSYGNVLAEYAVHDTIIWKEIWTGGDSKIGELDVPSVPQNPGEYVLSLYLDGMSVGEVTFTIS